MSSHYYNTQGTLVKPWAEGALPSPSTILDMVRDIELENLRNMLGSDEMDSIMERTSIRGTRIHQLCEDWIAGKRLEFEAFEDIDYFIGFQNWCEKECPKIIASEQFVMSPKYKYGGRLDLVVELDGERWVIDIKTGMFRHKHGLQLKFYEQAYYEMVGKHSRMGVLGLTDKNKCGYRRLKETKEPLSAILAPLAVFKWWRKKNPARKPVEEAIWKV